MRFTGFYILICGLLLALLLSSCSRHNARPSAPIYGFRASKAEFNLGDAARFEYKLGSFAGDGQRRLLISYAKHDRASGEKLGEFSNISNDGGASFGPERPLPAASLSGSTLFAYSQSGWSAVYVSHPRYSDAVWNIFYTHLETDGATWSEPVQINDEQDSVVLRGGRACSFIQPSENEIDCVWTDKRRGFALLFFSASHDGGRTWTPNQAVEHDFREGTQSGPQIVVGAEGRLLAFWQDERDRQTLFDIRCSYSDDGGQHWSPSQKINDDREPVWQTEPVAVASGNQIYLAFTDFREPGEEGGNDWNIYSAASSDNGRTWKQNIRLNDVQAGVDDRPRLVIDDRGILYCLWQSGRESILGEVYFAHSTDGGQSWSPSIKVSEGDELLYRKCEDSIMAVAVYFFVVRSYQSQIEDEQNKLLAKAIVDIRREQEAARRDVALIANLPVIAEYLEAVADENQSVRDGVQARETTARANLQLFFNQNPYYLQLSLVDAQGQDRVRLSKLPQPDSVKSIGKRQQCLRQRYKQPEPDRLCPQVSRSERV